jgi:hypothetical protein
VVNDEVKTTGFKNKECQNAQKTLWEKQPWKIYPEFRQSRNKWLENVNYINL